MDMKKDELLLENVQELSTEELMSCFGGDYEPGIWHLFGPISWGLYSIGYLAGRL